MSGGDPVGNWDQLAPAKQLGPIRHKPFPLPNLDLSSRRVAHGPFRRYGTRRTLMEELRVLARLVAAIDRADENYPPATVAGRCRGFCGRWSG